MNKSKKGTILASQDEKLTFYSFELQELREVEEEKITQQENILMKATILINNSQIISM